MVAVQRRGGLQGPCPCAERQKTACIRTTAGGGDLHAPPKATCPTYLYTSYNSLSARFRMSCVVQRGRRGKYMCWDMN